MKKVCFLTNNIGQCGGIERLISSLSMSLSEKKEIDLTILSLYSKPNTNNFFGLSVNTECIHAGCSYNRAEAYLISFFNDRVFDDLVTFHPGIDILIARIIKKIKPIKWIVTEHSDPGFYTWKRRLLNLYSFKKADCFIALTDNMAAYYHKRMIRNIIVIPNPVSFICTENNALNTPRILAVGRIEEVKQFDLLIKAFGSIEPQFPHWKLSIAGGGTQFDALQKEAEMYNNVELLGQRSDIKKLMLDSSIFVISSRYEGFSIVALEAMECGLPIISTELPSIRSITKGYDCCTFVDTHNYIGLAEKMKQLMCNPELINLMGAESKKCAEQYHINVIADRWKNIL